MRKRMTAGERFGRLVTIQEAERSRAGKARWLCRCECGTEKIIGTSGLRSGDIVSCGCYMRERLAELRTTHGAAGPHGARKSTEYTTWTGIKKRCRNPKATSFDRYGGRGISICEKWEHDFSAFLADMGPRPSPAHSVERLDNDGDYAPSNCVWATREVQQNNRSGNRKVSFNGNPITVAQLAALSNVKYATVRCRLNRGWSPEDAINIQPSPISPQRRASTPLSPEKALPPRRTGA